MCIRFRFRLRTALIALVLTQLGLGWLSWKIDQGREQAAAVRELSHPSIYLSYDQDALLCWPDWLVDLIGPDMVAPVAHVFADDGMLSKVLVEASRLTDLNALDMDDDPNDPVDENELRHLARLRRLRTLSFFHPRLTSIGGKHLAAVQSLEEICLSGGEISPEAIPPLRLLPRLRSLDICRAPALSDESIVALRDFPSLAELALCNTEITDDELTKLLAPFPPEAPRPTLLDRLRYLSLDGTYISDESLQYVAQIKHLQGLSLIRCNVGDEGIQHLAKLRHLQALNVEYTNVSDASLPALRKLTQLTHLRCSQSRITLEGRQSLRDTGITLRE